jgi:hypothetical protein
MYNLKITNNYFHTLHLDNPDANNVNYLVAPGATVTFKDWGNHIIYVRGMGEINFIDLADKKLPQYTSSDLPWTQQTWGGLIRYRGLDAYFRYEGGTTVEAVVDNHGCLDLKFEKGGMIVHLADVTVSEE